MLFQVNMPPQAVPSLNTEVFISRPAQDYAFRDAVEASIKNSLGVTPQFPLSVEYSHDKSLALVRAKGPGVRVYELSIGGDAYQIGTIEPNGDLKGAEFIRFFDMEFIHLKVNDKTRGTSDIYLKAGYAESELRQHQVIRPHIFKQ